MFRDEGRALTFYPDPDDIEEFLDLDWGGGAEIKHAPHGRCGVKD